MERPHLKPWYRLSVEGGRSTLRYGGSVLEFEGAAAERLLPHLLPLLDGSRTVDDVVAALGEPVRPAVEHALSLLRAHDLLTAQAPPGAAAGARRCAELLAATDRAGRTVAALHGRLVEIEVHVLGSGPAAEPVGRLLQASGCAWVAGLGWEQPPPDSFVVAAPGAAEVPLLEEWNRRARAPWLQLLPFDGRLAAVGPVVVPGQTACHECYRHRRDSTIATIPDRTTGAYAGAPALDALLAGLAAHVTLRWLAAGDVGDAGVLIAVELEPELRCTRHFVHRVPRCHVCSPSARRAAASPWSAVPLESLVSPYVGVVRGVQEVLAGPADVRLVTAWCETAHPHVVSGGGSGSTVEDARAAAIGEAVERYSASCVDPDALVVATARELGAAAVDPRRFALFSARQYASPGFPYVPFDADTRLAWIAGARLPDGEPAWLPAQLVHLCSLDGEPRICRATSSGLACHTDRSEATLAALLEVIERDAFMLTWKARLSWPLLDWHANDELARFEERFIGPTGMRARAVDLSRVWDVPCAAAVVRSDAPGTAPLGVGAAAGVTIERAVSKALDEAARVRTWAEALHRYAEPAPRPSDIRDFDDHIRFYADRRNASRVAFLDESRRRRDVARVAPLRGASAGERVEALCIRLGHRSVSAYVVDVTSPDVRDAGVAVVRVVAPELCALDVEHEAPLHGGRRLYDEPCRLGLRPHALTEDELNPDPHPFP